MHGFPRINHNLNSPRSLLHLRDSNCNLALRKSLGMADRDGANALHIACDAGDVEIVRQVVRILQ